MTDYKYQILKFLISNGKSDVELLLSELTQNTSLEEIKKLKHNLVVAILECQSKRWIKQIREMGELHNRYFSAVKHPLIDDGSPIEIEIDDAGIDAYNKLDKIYNPTILQQNFYQTTHGKNSPIAGNDVSMIDFDKTNEEYPKQKDINKKILGLTKKQFIWSTAIGLALILLGILALRH